MLETSKADLLHRTPKVIEDPLTWKPRALGYCIEAVVIAPELEEDLRLVCTYGRTNFGFCLLYQNHPVRRYDTCPRHKDFSTGEVFINTPHKHTWDRDREDNPAHIPPDISPDGDLNDRLIAFLKEENIQLKGGYQRLMLR
jgi:hypothetical protein